MPRGTADIFFPTDFNLLQRVYLASACHVHGGASASGASGRSDDSAASGSGRGSAAQGGGAGRRELGLVDVEHMSTRRFMEQHADLARTTTLSGYNPLLEDYSNTAFFLASTELPE